MFNIKNETEFHTLVWSELQVVWLARIKIEGELHWLFRPVRAWQLKGGGLSLLLFKVQTLKRRRNL